MQIEQFDNAAYQQQCLTVVAEFKKTKEQNFSTDSYSQYAERVEAECKLLPHKIVRRIEDQIMRLGAKFRPIDAYLY